jgi:hypothetical protein
MLHRAGPIVSKLGQSLTESCEQASSPIWLNSTGDETTSTPQASRHGIAKKLFHISLICHAPALTIIMAVADHSYATAVKADNAVRPSELTNDFVALRFVEQVRQRDQVHHGFRSLPQRERPTDQLPDQDQHVELLPRTGSSIPCRGLFITPKPDKSLFRERHVLWTGMRGPNGAALLTIRELRGLYLFAAAIWSIVRGRFG